MVTPASEGGGGILWVPESFTDAEVGAAVQNWLTPALEVRPEIRAQFPSFPC